LLFTNCLYAFRDPQAFTKSVQGVRPSDQGDWPVDWRIGPAEPEESIMRTAMKKPGSFTRLFRLD
jgi:hypothetical protein